MSVRRLIYFSKAQAEAPADIDAILTTSRQRNASDGITGLLLHLDGVFAQVLEGVPSKISDVMSRIEADSRHSDIVVLADTDVDGRRFTDWSMAFMDTDTGDLLETAGLAGMDEAMVAIAEADEVSTDVIEAALEGFSQRLALGAAARA